MSDFEDKLISKVEHIFRAYRDRFLIEDELESLGFKKWAEIGGSPDEQLWAYDKGTPSGQVLVLINWLHGFAWVYKKVESVDLL